MTKAFVPTCLWTMSVLLASTTASSAVRSADASPPWNAGQVEYEIAGLSAADAERAAYAVDDGPGQAQAATQALSHAAAVNLRFATPEDAQEYAGLVSRANAVHMPDARRVARDFIRAQLGIDGDSHVVAHFRTPEDKRQGRPDQSRTLTEAVMEAFPDHTRHTRFALAADTVGGIFNGGSGSPGIVSTGEQLIHASDLKSALTEIGKFVWSRTGPGYIYQTFFAKGNVIEAAKEDHRSVDEAFGVYLAGGFTAEHETSIRLSGIIGKFDAPGAFSELPYVKALHAAMDSYWQSHGADWAVLARYRFVLSAKWAHQTGVLSEAQYRMVMRGGAPRVPLAGPVTMAQLRAGGKEAGTDVRRFDINGYTSSDLVRFIAPDGSEVMYVPGHDPAFVTASSESALRAWVLEQSRHPRTLESLLSHFSIHDSQDGVFWTGVKHGLENIGDGRWQADAKAIDHRNAAIGGDVFEDMRAVLERRVRDDARMQASTAGEAWRTTLNRFASLLSPLGFVRPLVIPVQVTLGVLQTGTGIEQGLDGRTWEERKSGWEEAGLTVVANTVLGGALGGGGEDPLPDNVSQVETRPFIFPPQQVNGKLGYPMGPIKAPRLPPESSIRLFVKDDRGSLGIWGPVRLEHATYPRIPAGVPDIETEGVIGLGNKKYVRLQSGGVVRVVPAGEGWRIRSKDGTMGPMVRRLREGFWAPDFNDYNFLKGSVLADRSGVQYTFSGAALQRAADVLEQFGSSEDALLMSGLKGRAGPLEALAIAHEILDTLPDRLRSVHNRRWTPWEAELFMPALARTVQRPIALYERNGTFRFGVHSDGTECGPNDVPATAIRVSPNGGEFILRDGTLESSMSPQPFINLVAGAAGEAFTTQGSARVFRSGLALQLEQGGMVRELEHIHRRWIAPLAGDAETRQVLEDLSRLRRALFFRDTELTPQQEAMLRKADIAWRETAPPQMVWPRIDAVLARLAQHDSQFAWLDAPYLKELFAQVVSEHDALLPRALQHLLVEDPAIVAHPAEAADAWVQDGRHYVRLRHLDGRTQVVETSAAEAGNRRQILLPGDAALRGSGRWVVDVDGQWFPEKGLRDGLALMRPLDDTAAPVSVDTHPPANTGPVPSIETLVNVIPQPLLRMLGPGLPRARIGRDGALEMDVRNPVTGRTYPFRLNRDMLGNPVPYGRTHMVLLDDTLGNAPRDEHLNVPVPDGLTSGGNVVVDRQGYEGLLHGEQPISAFVEAGYGGRHVKALVEVRRLRGMLREDRNLAVVGTTGEHVFGLVMPVDADSIALTTARDASQWSFRNLPSGTIVVDSMFDIRAGIDDYPALVRAKAADWEAQGIMMKRIGSQGMEVRESPLAFVDRMLSSPVRANLWNPAKDPISEVDYVRFIRSLYTKGVPVNHAGLDWLQTRNARRDYLGYFAAPYDVMPTWYAPPADDVPGGRMHSLAETALEAIARSN